MIHPTAVIHPKAQIDPSCVIGPYVVIDEHVVLGAQCWLGPHVHITGITKIGPRNRFHAGCVIGDAPQDLKYKGEPTGLSIGADNTFREHVTINRSSGVQEDTVIGSNNLLMASSHVGHNCRVGNHVIIANGTLLGGHVEIQDRAIISATCMLHQWARVGTLAMMQGGSGISKDLPPFTVARGNNGICGLNTIGLRRAGFSSESRLELRRLYLALFRSRKLWAAALAEAQAAFTSDPARTLLDFVAASKRGVCPDRSKSVEAEEG